MPPSYWNEAEWPSARSSTIEIFSPRVRKAVSRRRSSSVVKSKSSDSKMSASGRNVTVVAGALALAELGALLQRLERDAARVFLRPDVAVAADLDAEALRTAR